MTALETDVVILGSGFGGSLTALLLKQIGLNPILIDRGSHPRFAIGESSTPIADLVLRDLASNYNLSQLHPLTNYGSWQKKYPELVCGLKRGFSYFQHQSTSDSSSPSFEPYDDHSNELFVAASSDDESSDTHWLRSDVDHFFVEQVITAGIPYFDHTEIKICHNADGWVLEGHRKSDSIHVKANFVIDATGQTSVLNNVLGLADSTEQLHTNSRAIYAHFSNVKPWQYFLERAEVYVTDHPFCCENSALHHILEDGWMWQLRFNNGITSAGIVLDANKNRLDSSIPVEQEWQNILMRYPSIAEQFANATVVAPSGGLQRTGRLQRLNSQMVGKNWAMLPFTAGFIDPLHSTGIAQTLCGVERLVAILANHWDKTDLFDELQQYEKAIYKEFLLIDQLVSGCYSVMGNFRLLSSFSMLYFAAATTHERRRLESLHSEAKSNGVEKLRRATENSGKDCLVAEPFHTSSFPKAFLCADDPTFCNLVTSQRKKLETLIETNPLTTEQIVEFETGLAAAIEPYNSAGLCDPSCKNMYRYTSLPASS